MNENQNRGCEPHDTAIGVRIKSWMPLSPGQEGIFLPNGIMTLDAVCALPGVKPSCSLPRL